jgi:hypothetical protein
MQAVRSAADISEIGSSLREARRTPVPADGTRFQSPCRLVGTDAKIDGYGGKQWRTLIQ